MQHDFGLSLRASHISLGVPFLPVVRVGPHYFGQPDRYFYCMNITQDIHEEITKGYSTKRELFFKLVYLSILDSDIDDIS